MRNLLIGNLSRLFSKMGIYVTMLILLALSTLIVTTEATMGISRAYYGAETLRHIIIGMSNMVYLMLPLAILVLGEIFTNSTLEKDLTSRFSRTKIYLSHLVLSSAIGIIFTLAFIAWAVILSTSLRGFGDMPQNFLLENLSILGVQIILLLALNALATFLVFTFRRTSIVVGMYFALLIAPSVIEMLSIFGTEFVNIRAFDIGHSIVLTAQLPALHLSQIIQILSLGVGVVVFTTFFGIILFKLSAYKLDAVKVAHIVYCCAVYGLNNLFCREPKQVKQGGL